MNTTFEKEVITFLLRYDKNDVTVPDYPRLNPEVCRSVSKSITKIVCESIRNDNASTKQNREAVIELLSSWAKPVKPDHFEVNESNRNDFVNSLVTESDDEFSKFCKEIEGEVGGDFWEDVVASYENAYENETEKKLHTDLVKAVDDSILKKTGFDSCLPMRIVRQNDFHQAISNLKRNTERNVVDKAIFDPAKTILFQRDSNPGIGFGYALLNMESTTENSRLLRKIIEDAIGKTDEIHQNFLTMVWKNGYFDVINSCAFLYEKPVLKIATAVISSDVDDYVSLLLESDLRIFIEKITPADKVYYNVLNCFYELFIISNYNCKIRKLMSNFTELVNRK